MLEQIVRVAAFPATTVIWAAFCVGLTVAARMPAFKGE